MGALSPFMLLKFFCKGNQRLRGRHRYNVPKAKRSKKDYIIKGI